MKRFFTALKDHALASVTATRLLLLSWACLALLAGGAQAQQGELPRVREAAAPGAPSAPAYQSDRSSLPSRRYDIDFQPAAIAHVLEPLRADEAGGLAPNQIGITRAVGLRPGEGGSRFTNADGTSVHVLVITSPGARGLRLHFQKFDLPEGDEVYVYGTEGDYVGGPFGERGPQSAGDFWSGTVEGETVVVEYYTKGDGLPFLVTELSHMLSDPQAADSPSPSATLSCELDASCYTDVEKNAVARMLYQKPGGTFVCTGTLMNTTNASFTPYFMTANHCISTQTTANTLETYWFYQTSSCNIGTLRSGIVHLTSGAQLLATSQSADATLLRLNDNAPAGAVFSGWDANERPLNDSVFGLHHPGIGWPPSTDSYLRRASGPIAGTSESCSASGLTGGYFVDWSQGLTEPGSSGSGLWYTNGGNHYYVGTLSCGPAQPDCVTTYSLYGKFSAFFSLVSSYLAPAPPTTGLQYFPLAAPVRLLDTRPGASACDAPGAPLTAGVARTEAARITCTGIPASAQAVVGNATVVNNTGAGGGFVTLYPAGASRPNVSNLNYTTGQVVPNAFTVGLGSTGAFNVYAQTGVHFIVDVTGYYAPPATGGRYFHLLPSPVRLLDTRAGLPACQNTNAPLAGGAVRTQSARLTCGGVTIPSTAQAVVGNATVVNNTGAAGGFITLYSSGVSRPNVSNLNYVSGQVVPNAFTVSLGSDGAFNIYPQTTVNFIVDIVGYFSSQQTDANGTGLLYSALAAPVRLLDTRAGLPACDSPGSPLTAGAARTEAARITCTGIPASALSVVGNATVVNDNNAAGGFVTLYASGAARPGVSNLNYVTGQVVPNAFTVGLGSDGAFNIYAQTGINFIADVSGYYAP